MMSAEPAIAAGDDSGFEPGRYEFDAGFQMKICALALRDSVFMQRTDGLVDPGYFENLADASLINMALRYYTKYKKAPGDLTAIVRLLQKDIEDKIVKKETVPMIKERLKGLLKADISDRDLVVDEVATFARHQAVSKAILESVTLLDRRDFSRISASLEKALNVGAHSDQAVYSYSEMIDVRTEEREDRLSGKSPPTGISTGYAEIDRHLHHKGWGKQELAVVMGGAKAGKTTALINFAVNAASNIARYNTLYVTLEVSKGIVASRIDANISQQLMHELDCNYRTVSSAVKEWSKTAGYLNVIEFPTGQMRVSDLRRQIEKDRMRGIKYDFVVVDYADLMAPERYSKDPIENSKSIYIDLRALAQIEDVAMLTATQTNREGTKAAVAKMTDVADDFNKIRIADVVISINKTDEEKACGEARLYFAAIRNSASGFSIRIKQDIDRMAFIKSVIGVES